MVAYIFNCDNDTLNAELHRYIPVSAGLEAETIAPPLSSAYMLFVHPLLGEELSAAVQDMAGKVPPSDKESGLLDALRMAVANLAFWYGYTELSVQITDQGFQRPEGETFKGLYKYQEDALRMGFKNKGFNALDRFLEMADKNPGLFPEGVYADSPVARARAGSLVRHVEEVDRYYFINGSYLVFLRLLPHFRTAALTVLRPLLGAALLSRLEREDGEEMEVLRQQCLPVVVLAAVAELVEATGSLTDRGLYYASLMPSSGSTLQAQPADVEQRVMALGQIRRSLEAYKDALTYALRESLGDDFPGRPAEAYDRDNTHKRTFWA